jgi:hypothetical protein
VPVICPYCHSKAKLEDSEIIYGRSYGLVWVCSKYPECDSYVGVHKGTSRPLGIMANAELRLWKKRAHTKFDPLWKTGIMKRSFAYQLLRETLHLSKDQAHIGEMDVEQCKLLIDNIPKIKLLKETR